VGTEMVVRVFMCVFVHLLSLTHVTNMGDWPYTSGANRQFDDW